jgi:hypothetical protein
MAFVSTFLSSLQSADDVGSQDTESRSVQSTSFSPGVICHEKTNTSGETHLQGSAPSSDRLACQRGGAWATSISSSSFGNAAPSQSSKANVFIFCRSNTTMLLTCPHRHVKRTSMASYRSLFILPFTKAHMHRQHCPIRLNDTRFRRLRHISPFLVAIVKSC